MTDGALFYALTPSYRPVGGVIKVLDYAIHALELGHRIVVACPKPFDAEVPLFEVPGMDVLLDNPDVRFKEDLRIAPQPDDLVFFSWPTHGRDVANRLPSGFPMARVIHIVQNVRHANPTFAEGFAVRLLSRPISRIVINDQVREAIDPFLDGRLPTVVIPLGHRTGFFHQDRGPGFGTPIRVGYTTWKSEIGHEVRDALHDDPRFAFDAIETEVGWNELRELYRWCDVFLAAPNVEEGFYLPGLEAMAAGAVVVTPDVGGNMAYCRFDENCLGVGFEDVDDYVAALQRLAAEPLERINDLRARGRVQVERHALDQERAAFRDLLEEIDRIAPPMPRSWPGWVGTEHSRNGRDVLLTGVPRSGTTLVTHLLNDVPNTVALSEPLRPVSLMGLMSDLEVVEAYGQFLQQQRAQILDHGRARSKSIDGEETDNHFTSEPTDEGLRREIATLAEIEIDKQVGPDFTLVVKDLPTTTALVAALSRRFDCYAVLRNPIALLASWATVDIPIRHGRSPHAEWFDEDLARRLQSKRSEDGRMVELLGWWFERITDALPRERVILYEDLVSDPSAEVARIVPAGKELDAALESRNRNPVYQADAVEKLGEQLLGSDGAYWRWYDRSEVESLMHDLGANGDM